MLMPNHPKYANFRDRAQTTVGSEVVNRAMDFDVSHEAELRNVFSSKHKSLDKTTRADLLQIQNEGKARFRSYVR